MSDIVPNPPVAPPQVVVAQMPVPGTPEHAARMAAMAPANIPAQYKNADGSVNLAALTEGFRAQGQAQAPAKPEADPLPGLDFDIDAAMSQAATTGPTPWQKLQAELDAGGKISDATRKELKEKNGLDDTTLASLEAGHRAQQAQAARKLADSVGGVENLRATLQFASSKYPQAELDQLRASLKGPMGTMILKGLAAEMNAHRQASQTPTPRPSEPKSILDLGLSGGPSQEVKAFKSVGEMLVAIRDPKYTYDPDYREQVARRIHAGQTPPR